MPMLLLLFKVLYPRVCLEVQREGCDGKFRDDPGRGTEFLKENTRLGFLQVGHLTSMDKALGSVPRSTEKNA